MAEPTPDQARQLVSIVRGMRAAQRRFFKPRDAHDKASALGVSKALEREVDAMLDELDAPPSQPTLFPTEPRRGGAYSNR
jgi:hypothetical protein